MMQKGAFICIEGLDGSGKTTHAKLLVEKLKKSHNAIFTAEPSSGKIGTFIRKSFLYGKERPSSVIEALLFAADRIEHLNNEVLPALNIGRLVICDRYIYSSLAYQGSTGLNLDWIKDINRHALQPDLAIFIDVAPEIVLQRLNRKKSIMEKLETQRKVREIYLRFVANGELMRVNGDGTLDEVAETLFSTVMQFLESFRSR